ncbi:thioredoxin [Selenihalanaerobacter shriftii]|uniref:Thioredoxin n=1 Tax=Selenihalanaerobacter shriftii TaxID=142842 RepID=A0A1T4LTU3_9FIRM|nr:thioredoxin [Selenihalanaerobacter shriftii]SJZ58051.1 thioredoxin [Selenihalanaerobacter shriftii]
MAGENVIELNGDNFEEEVLETDKKVLVDFWAPWCGPCKQIAPIVEELADEYADEIKVGKVNVDNNQSLAANYGVMSIPTLLLFKDGEVANQQVGFVGKDALKDFING